MRLECDLNYSVCFSGSRSCAVDWHWHTSRKAAGLFPSLHNPFGRTMALGLT